MKDEFIKAIMSVLRLEPNIFTTGAIEMLVNRLEVSDYQIFIAYLGERKSDYEKPIESIAKGVEEFYEKKLKPHRDYALNMQKSILAKIRGVNEHLQKEIDKSVYDNEDTENFDFNKRKKMLDKKLDEIYQDKSRENHIFNRFEKKANNEPFFSKEEMDIVFNIGIHKFRNMADCRDIIFEFLMQKYTKPSITEQIVITQAKKLYEEPLLLSKKVKELTRKVEFWE